MRSKFNCCYFICNLEVLIFIDELICMFFIAGRVKSFVFYLPPRHQVLLRVLV
jgi:ubiquitin C-terminal hydrolase